MIDYNNIPQNINKQIFNAAGNTWQTWTKPSGARTAFIVCIGGGGGGGGGASGVINSNRGGGGGGGSSATTIAQVPLYCIPDRLYVQVGLGGAGGAPGSSGGTGGISYVSFYPNTSMSNCLIVNSLSVTPSGGGGGTGGGGGGNFGTELSANSSTNPRYLSLCNWASYIGSSAGGAGGAGGSGTPGNNSTVLNWNINSGGGGGGGAGNSTIIGDGGYVQGGEGCPWIIQTDTSSSILYMGRIGYYGLKPVVFVGGNGGNSTPNGTGINGGNGSFGCGGGGGGAGITGGRGGNGGDGLVMIISY